MLIFSSWAAAPAGLTAAIYARRAGKSVLVLEKEAFGGQIASSPRVDNFPGCYGVSGAELAERLFSQAEALGARVELEEVQAIQTGAPHIVTTDYGGYTASALILATGMKHRTLGLPGGGDSAGGLLLRRVRRRLLCRTGRGSLRRRQYRPPGCPVPFGPVPPRDGDPPAGYLPGRSHPGGGSGKAGKRHAAHEHAVTALLGQDALTGLALRDTVTGMESELAVSGLFQAVGQQPRHSWRLPWASPGPTASFPPGRTASPPPPACSWPETAGPSPSGS